MRLESVTIQNYKSFSETLPIRFYSGFNLIVGKNNAGKSSLLKVLSASFLGHPHLRESVSRDTVERSASRVGLIFNISGEDLRRLLLQQGFHLKLVWPSEIEIHARSWEKAIEIVFKQSDLLFGGIRQARKSSGSEWVGPTPAMAGYPTVLPDQDGAQTLTINFVEPEKGGMLNLVAGPEPARDGDFGNTVAQLLARHIYVFEAQRRCSSACQQQWGATLSADASNLADVLHTMHSRRQPLFQEFFSLCREVFPDICGMSFDINSTQGSHVEVRLWLVPPTARSEDLTISLDESGSGISQVLAMLYVIVAQSDAQVIAIDEPSSFLHPDAVRALLRIFRTYPNNQYIIATHSSEVISGCTDASITILQHRSGRTNVEQYAGGEVEHVRAALNATGAKLSDLFGYDRVLWVEGPSDALVYEWLIEVVDAPSLDRTAIRPVTATGDFEPASIDRTLSIYHSLSHAKALVPVTLGFLFDRDGRTEKEVEDGERRPEPKVRFLDAMMMENYFLDPQTIATVLSDLEPPLAKKPSSDEVRAWMSKEFPDVGVTSDWKLRVHGKTVQRKAFSDFSNATYEYKQVDHLPMLVVQQSKVNATPLIEIVKKLVEMQALSAKMPFEKKLRKLETGWRTA